MTSLRRATLIWMTLLLLLVGLLGAGAAYLLDLSQANGLLDGQLRQIALGIGNGLPEPAEAALPAVDDAVVIDIWNDRGDKLFSTAPGLGVPRLAAEGLGGVTAGGQAWRAYLSLSAGRAVQASQRVRVRTNLAQTAVLEAAAPILLMIPLGWLVIGKALRRALGHLSVVAADVAARGAETRHLIPVEAIPAEVLPLVDAMNLLIGRLQTSIEQQKRFVSDAAHELRTPLTALRLQIGNLQPAIHEAGLDAALADLAAGADRAAALIDQLLRLARYEGAADHADDVPVEVVPLILACLADHLQVAEAKQVDLGIVASDPTVVRGNSAELRILFGNLIQNAVRYTPPGGIVDVAVRGRDGRVTVAVADTGRGIRPDLLPRVFDRFFRAAPLDIEGTGLGLSICKAIATRHGMTVTLENRTDRQGLVASVTAPALEGAGSRPA